MRPSQTNRPHLDLPPITWTPIPSISGRRVIVTGANSGIGLQTSLALAGSGAVVTMACRNPDKAETALRMVQERTGNQTCNTVALDLSSLESIRNFAGRVKQPVDVLINNAGVMAPPLSRTHDGFEMQFGVNHLGHFALTGLLMDQLRAGSVPRVVTLSSIAHRRGKIRFEDLNSEKGYRRWRAYSQSKLANLYFATELERWLRTKGTDVISIAAHPGVSGTNLTKRGGHRGALDLLGGVFAAMGQPAAAACLPTLYAATGADVQGGDYYGPSGPGELRGTATLVAPSPAVLDEEIAHRLWKRSEELTGVNYC
ncbi:oxidoreductase [Arthrobacter roseus]|uniref:oxidoreductase n=1 Tax=Arthrobacter roseus TaxID=136274 RepID=UPI00196491C6|nr:oxidoreductase [Arthrobacter roseus]MBM7848954.1 NAD(P)-dependent dehydrogenase (short-subunit alcohol dehydrogenase family) [Arthrobacter roseus]